MMSRPQAIPVDRWPPALRRLAALTPLDEAALHVLTAAIGGVVKVAPRRELVTEGRPIVRPLLLLEGWAVRVRLLPDGRRQFISFLLPGDAIGLSGYDGARAPCTVAALTAVMTCPLPQATTPALDRALAIGRSLDEAYLVAQIMRLGRLNARERILDLVLELHERLSLAGLAQGDGFELPLTQEALADALGLTSVHINRMVQQLRRSGDLEWIGQRLRLPDVAGARCKLSKSEPNLIG